MKAKILGKNKYIIAIIALALVFSIGMSFCAWDSDNLLSKVSAKSADYGKEYFLGIDKNSNAVADVGDTVLFGKYYQQANETTKTALEWRVVDIRKENGKDVMYLLTEQIVAFGGFCGTGYYYGENGNISGHNLFNACYDNSTLRAWLNSEDREVDKGVGFSNPPATNHVVYKGFYNEAFTATQKNAIIARDIGGGKGGTVGSYTITQYSGVKNQKVWAPSLTEIFGRIDFAEPHVEDEHLVYFNYDYVGDTQFSYFIGAQNSERAAKSTIFSTTLTSKGLANFTNPEATHPYNLGTNELDVEKNARWFTRSAGSQGYTTLLVMADGSVHSGRHGSYGATIGVRPAICLAR